MRQMARKPDGQGSGAWPRVRTLGLLALGVVGVGGVLAALVRLQAPLKTLRVEKTRLRGIPVTVYAPQGGAHGPAIVIVHGFAGSQQMMAPFAVTLARSGYTAVTLDLPGHGQNAHALRGELADFEPRYQQFRDALDQVMDLARSHSNGQIGLLGHSMGSSTVARYAREHPDINAVVAVSLVYSQIEADSPRNLLVITGAFERGLMPLAQQVIDDADGGTGVMGQTYGSVAEGTARRAVVAPGVEHIGVLYSPTSLSEALAWFDLCLRQQQQPQPPVLPPQPTPPYLDDRIRWIALLSASAALLYGPFAELLRRQQGQSWSAGGAVAALPLRWWFGVALAPALLAPVLLRLVPPSLVRRLMPVLVGGTAATFFALYGALTGAGVALAYRAQTGTFPSLRPLLHDIKRGGPAALLTFGYVSLMFGVPLQRYLINYFPAPQRLPVAATTFATMLPYFLADEVLARSPAAPRGAYVITKASFLGSLALAIALDPNRLFFLIITAPVLAAYFALYGAFSTLSYARCGSPVPGALSNAAIFSTTIAALFPLTER